MRKNVVAEKSLSFAVRVVRLYQRLVDEKREFAMSKQVLRNGTSIGANVREASSAQSKADFVLKCSMGLIAVGATFVCVLHAHKAARPEKVVEFTSPQKEQWGRFFPMFDHII